MTTFEHDGVRCTVTETSLVFDSAVRTPLDSDWSCEIAEYTRVSTYSDYLHSRFPLAMVEEIEALLRARGAFDVRPADPAGPGARATIALPPARPRPTRLEVESLAAAIMRALGSPLGEGVWSEVELEPWAKRQATSERTAGGTRLELSLIETFCDSSAGPRTTGANARIVIDLGERGRIEVAFPPMVVEGPSAVLEVLVNAGVIEARHG